MKRLTVIEGEKLPSKMELDEFEVANNIRLPPSFKAFILHQNPVYVEESFFFVEGREPYDITFFPFSEDSEYWTIQRSFEDLFEGFFERKYLPFGCDSGGLQYVVSVQEHDYGRIYFCRMDEELQDALTLLAPSFEEFVNGLTDSEE
jgi:hypothetical protein